MLEKRIVQDGDINIYVEYNNGVINVNTKRKIPETLTSLPYIETEGFFGRQDDITKLKELLNVYESPANVYGLGGIGKSTFAKYFLKKYREEFKHLAWVSQVGQIRDTFIHHDQLIDSLVLETERQESYSNPQISFFDTLINRLRMLKGNNLLIIDAASSELEDLRLRDQLMLEPNWRVIILSRQIFEGYRNFMLEPLADNDLRELFAHHYYRESNSEVVSEIIELVDRNTLAIEIVARNAQAGRLSLFDLLSRLKKKGLTKVPDNMIRLRHNNNLPLTNVYKYLAAAFSLEELDDTARFVMLQFAVMPSVQIPYEGDLSLQTFLDWKNEEERSCLVGGLNDLTRLGWIRWDKKADTFQMHVIVQEVTRMEVKPDFRNCNRLVFCILRIIHNEQHVHPAQLIRFIPYAENLIKYIRDPRREMMSLANNIGEILRHHGDSWKAIRYLSYALLVTQKHEPDNLKDISIGHNNLASAYQYLATQTNDISFFKGSKRSLTDTVNQFRRRNLEKSLDHFQRSLAILARCEPLSEELRKGQAAVLNNIAQTYRYLDRHTEAYEYLMKAIKLQESLVTDKYHLPLFYNNAALLLDEWGRFPEALDYVDKAVKLLQTDSPKRNVELGMCYSTLTSMYYNFSRLTQDVKALGVAKAYADVCVDTLLSVLDDKSIQLRQAKNTQVWINITYEAVMEKLK